MTFLEWLNAERDQIERGAPYGDKDAMRLGWNAGVASERLRAVKLAEEMANEVAGKMGGGQALREFIRRLMEEAR